MATKKRTTVIPGSAPPGFVCAKRDKPPPIWLAEELLAKARAEGHQHGCQCRGLSVEKAKLLDKEPRYGCVELRRVLLASGRWRVVYGIDDK